MQRVDERLGPLLARQRVSNALRRDVLAQIERVERQRRVQRVHHQALARRGRPRVSGGRELHGVAVDLVAERSLGSVALQHAGDEVLLAPTWSGTAGSVRLVGELAGGADFGHVLAVELVEDALQRAILRERVLANERFGLDAVDADVLGVARGDQEVSVGRVADRPEVLALHVVLRRELVRAPASARQIATPVDGSLDLRCA